MYYNYVHRKKYLLCNEDGCHANSTAATVESVVVILLALPEAVADGGETQGLDRGGWERL